MKNRIKIVALVAIAAITGITVYNTQFEELQMSSLAMENVEAIASGEGSGSCGGYRSWNTSGFLQHKKEFYDCTCTTLRQGYSPSGNC